MKKPNSGHRGQEKDHREFSYEGKRPTDGYSDGISSPYFGCGVQGGSAAGPQPQKDPRGDGKTYRRDF